MSTIALWHSHAEARIRERGNYASSVLGGALPVLALPLLWRYEEQSKAVSLGVTALVYLLGVLLLNLAHRAGIVSDRAPWIRVFAFKLVLSFLITSFLWVAPLEPNLLRVSQQNLGLQDANIYDYLAVRIAEEGLAGNVQLLWFTWLSVGITGYLSLIYSLFGISILYVSLFNALLSLAGILALTGTLAVLDAPRRRWQLLRFAMLLPFGSYYDGTPAKEPLTHAFFYAGLYFIARLLARKGRPAVNIVCLAVVLALLATVRLNVAILLLAANLGYFLRRLEPVKLAILGAAGVMTLVAALVWTNPEPGAVASQMFDLGRRLDHSQMLFTQRASSGDTALKLAVGEALTPRSVVDLVGLAPVRLAVWLFLPYPHLIPDFARLTAMPEMLIYDRIGYFRFASELPAQLSAILLVILFPHILDGFRAMAKGWPTRFLAANLLIPALVISNLMLVMGRRYRILLEPLLVAMALWGIQYGPRGRLRYVVYFGFAAGLAAASFYQVLGAD